MGASIGLEHDRDGPAGPGFNLLLGGSSGCLRGSIKGLGLVVGVW